MPLAGRMKLRTFLVLGGGVALLALAGLGAGGWYLADAAADAVEKDRAARAERQRILAEAREERGLQAARERRERELRERERQQRLEQERGEQGSAPLASPEPTVDVPGDRPVDAAVMRHLGTNMGTKKRKDVTSGLPYKVNVYQDDGNARANRAKLDLDRDDKWDEKWTWSEGTITRKIAPNDDENYTVEEVWREGGWRSR